MQYLHILNCIRWVTGQRQAHFFPNKGCTLEVFGALGSGTGVLFVYDTRLGKSVLESAEFGQYNFIERAAALAGEEQTVWIRRFCSESPVMLDGPSHQVQRRELADVLQRCSGALHNVTVNSLASNVRSAASLDGATSLSVGEEIVSQLFAACFTAITGHDVNIPTAELMAVDFFNPFPKPSTLQRCDHAIGVCMEALGWPSLTRAEVMAVSVLLVMGISPLLATVTASINTLLESLCLQNDSTDAAVAACRRVDFYSTVPTNFVIRRCLKAITIESHELEKEDLVYVFLGPANGCPLSRLTTIPFGAGRHACSGTKLSFDMLALSHEALELAAPALRTLPVVDRRSPAAQGRASAFLSYARSPPAV